MATCDACGGEFEVRLDNESGDVRPDTHILLVGKNRRFTLCGSCDGIINIVMVMLGNTVKQLEKRLNIT